MSELTALDREVKSVQTEHPGWSYERSLTLVVSAREQADRAKDPKLAKELARHAKQERARGANNTDLHTERLVAIRKLREKNPELTFDQAFVQVLGVGAPSSVAASKDCAIKAASRRGLIYVEGGKCDWFIPLPGTRE